MSTLVTSNISDGTDTVETEYVVHGSAKSWAKVSGAAAVSNSLNISSVTDNSTGFFTFFFASDFTDANYSAVASAMTSNDRDSHCSGNTASEVSTRTFDISSSNPTDSAHSLHVIGDLA